MNKAQWHSTTALYLQFVIIQAIIDYGCYFAGFVVVLISRTQIYLPSRFWKNDI